jgi:hypothetical protein
MTILMNASALKLYLILLACCLVLVPSARAQQSREYRGPRYSARNVRLKIEVRQSTFRVGDSVNVRLTLHNTSDHLVKYMSGFAIMNAQLRVFDAEGHRVKTTLISPIILASNSLDSLAPDGRRTLRNEKGQEWVNLQDFAYDLREPGKYTIVGIPGAAGPRLSPDSTVRSNRVNITIKP